MCFDEHSSFWWLCVFRPLLVPQTWSTQGERSIQSIYSLHITTRSQFRCDTESPHAGRAGGKRFFDPSVVAQVFNLKIPTIRKYCLFEGHVENVNPGVALPPGWFGKIPSYWQMNSWSYNPLVMNSLWRYNPLTLIQLLGVINPGSWVHVTSWSGDASVMRN